MSATACNSKEANVKRHGNINSKILCIFYHRENLDSSVRYSQPL